MRKAIVLMAIGILAVMPLVGCTSTPAGGDGSATPPPTLAELQQQINSLSSTLSTLNGRVSNLDSAVAGLAKYDDTAIKQQLSTLQTTLTVLQTTLTAIDARVTALENPSGSNNTSVSDTTRWSIDVWLDTTSYNIADANIPSKKIEDEGDYNLYLLLYNYNINSYATGAAPESAYLGDLWWDGNKMWKTVETGEEGYYTWAAATMSDIYKPVIVNEIDITFHPNTGDRVKINAGETYLDNYYSPFLDWEVTVSERDDGTCRSIRAISGIKFTLPIPEGFNNVPESPTPYEMRLLFELYYA